MPAGAAVIPYEGKRGRVWRVKYRDASGKQVMETLGSARDGWTKRKAEAALRAKLVAVEADAYVRPTPETFATFVEGWADRHADARGLKASTRQGYRLIVSGHLLDAFGPKKVGDIDVDLIEAYVAAKQEAGYSAKTIHRQLVTLGLILRAALKTKKIQMNPVSLVDRPKVTRRRWRILTPVEVAAVDAAFVELIGEAEDDAERAWREQCRVVFLVAMETGMRRGEIQGLHWRSVKLADPERPYVEVAETWTRSRWDTPKSESGYRKITLHPQVASELFDHRGRSSFSGDDELVFCSSRGTPFGANRYAITFRLALGKAGISDYVRPFHDLRHSSITNGAAAHMSQEALQARAGHASYQTTEGYIERRGMEFAEEDAKLVDRLWGPRDRSAQAAVR